MSATQLAETPCEDPWTAVQLKIARRADEFARRRSNPKLLNLHCWLLAEAEFLGRDFVQLGKFAANDPSPSA